MYLVFFVGCGSRAAGKSLCGLVLKQGVGKRSHVKIRDGRLEGGGYRMGLMSSRLFVTIYYNSNIFFFPLVEAFCFLLAVFSIVVA